MTDDKDTVTFSFNYANNFTNEYSEYSRTYPDSFVTWDIVLEDFINFLSANYGYSIRENISIEPARMSFD